MSNIELTDGDGDALTIYIRGESTWITCTSGAEEVTVGPFATHVVRSFVDRGFEVEAGTLSSLVRRGPGDGSSPRPGPGPDLRPGLDPEPGSEHGPIS
jgi:hypothetical protein